MNNLSYAPLIYPFAASKDIDSKSFAQLASSVFCNKTRCCLLTSMVFV